MLKMQSLRFVALVFCLLALFTSCGNDPEVITEFDLKVNLSKVAPLSARLELRTQTDVALELRVKGKNGDVSDAVLNFPSLSDDFSINKGQGL